ncbi:MAG: SRPBCC family protein [Deltaproteobacteria bacterium]|nr:SRPBCC family protein [Deltaproteobacteria bacterium]
MLFALLAAPLAGALAAGAEFTPEELAKLGKGDVVRRISPDNGKDGRFGGSGWALIDAAPDKVWTAIQDWKNYPEIFPNTVETSVISRREGRSLIRMKLGHPIISITYHVEMAPEAATWTMRFKLVRNFPSDLDAIDGYWRLYPIEGGRTLCSYILNVHVPSGIVNILPDSFKRMAVRGVLGVPGSVKQWVERREQRKPATGS